MPAAAATLPLNAPAEECCDRQLLARYLAGDESAFTQLVERHQVLVLGACRRILKLDADAEDAFQATFLVLARRARSVTWEPSIAGWLLLTARRTALKLLATTRRRERQERHDVAVEQAAPATASGIPERTVLLRELATVLDEELLALPPQLREVLLLSQVEGLDRQTVAVRTGLSLGAVKDRLERAREQLRARLTRRGVTVSAAMLAVWLVPSATPAAATTLASTTASAAAVFAAGGSCGASIPASVSLAQGVLNMLAIEKVKSATLLLCAFLTAGTLTYGMLRDEPERFARGLVGEIVAIERSTQPATVTIRLDEFDTLLNLDLAQEVEVWNAFESATIADVSAGAWASLRLADDHRQVREIHLQGTTREVTIREIAADGRLTFVDSDDDDAARTPQSAELAPQAILRIGGLPATRHELRPGQSIPIELSADGARINAIEAEAEDDAIAWGQLVSMEAERGELILRTENDDDQEVLLTLRLLPETLVIRDGVAADPTTLAPGSELVVRRSRDGQGAMAIQATTPAAEEDDDE